jgi:hypothetical protein
MDIMYIEDDHVPRVDELSFCTQNSSYVLGVVPIMAHFSTRSATRKMHVLTQKRHGTEKQKLLYCLGFVSH